MVGLKRPEVRKKERLLERAKMGQKIKFNLSAEEIEKEEITVDAYDVLNELTEEDCIEHFGSKKFIDSLDLDDIIKHHGKDSVLSNFNIDEKLEDEKEQSVINYAMDAYGKAPLLDDIGVEESIEHFGIESVMNYIDTDELTKELYSRLDPLELMQLMIDLIRKNEK